eukprot:124676-Rhodomonas_salina.5
MSGLKRASWCGQSIAWWARRRLDLSTHACYALAWKLLVLSALAFEFEPQVGRRGPAEPHEEIRALDFAKGMQLWDSFRSFRSRTAMRCGGQFSDECS